MFQRYKKVFISLAVFSLFLVNTLVTLQAQENDSAETKVEETEIIETLDNEISKEESFNELDTEENDIEDNTIENQSIPHDELDERVSDPIIFDDEEMPIQEEKIESATPRVADYNINNILNKEELAFFLENAEPNSVLTLSNNFTVESMELTFPAYSLIIDAKNVIWNKDSISIVGEALDGVTLTINNLSVIQPVTTSAPVILNHYGKGELILDNLLIDGTRDHGSIRSLDQIACAKPDANKPDDAMKEACTSNTTINNSIIKNAISTNVAAAINLKYYGNLTLNYVTIENNEGTGAGYATGAISADNSYIADVTINNSIFRNNTNSSSNSGIRGGGGGAMAFHYFLGNIVVNDSYFIGNKSSGENESQIKDTFDGGAIYVFDGRAGATVTINGSTFEDNLAYDDGGAVYLQGTGNPGLTTSIVNSTFFNNTAYGYGGSQDDYAGGAIQYFKNGGSAKMTNTILTSTFVGNQAGGPLTTGKDQRGGAIGLSGAGIFATAAVTRNSSFFLANKVYGPDGLILDTSNYKDVSNYTTQQPKAGETSGANFINQDKGEAKDDAFYTKYFGTNRPILADNFSTIKAGKETIVVPTVRMNSVNLSEIEYNGTVSLPEKDQRGYLRDKGLGAIQNRSILYNSNDGIFELEPLEQFEETIYYEVENDGIKTFTKEYYTIGVHSEESNPYSSTIIQSQDNLKAEREGYRFMGWNTQRDGSGEDYAVGDSYNYGSENIVLYAQWAPVLKVSYDGNGSLSGTVPSDDTEYLAGDDVTLMNQGNLEREGYRFVGWNTQADGLGTSYKAGDIFTLSENTTLYAEWEKVVRVTYSILNDDVSEDHSFEFLPNSEILIEAPHHYPRTGYRFLGYKSSMDNDETLYNTGDTLLLKEDNVILTQVWAKILTVSYDAHEGIGELPIDDKEYIAGEYVTVLPVDTLVKEGYTFKGWALSLDENATIYQAGDGFVLESDVTLHAVWEEDFKEPSNPEEEKPVLPDPEKPSLPNGPKLPSTGMSQSTLWLALATLGVGILALSYILRKKKK